MSKPVPLNITASHEIGHVMLINRWGLTISEVSVLQGLRLNPRTVFAARGGLHIQQNMEISLAGWSGEAFYKSHTVDSEKFSIFDFVAHLPTSGSGAGWPLKILDTGEHDLGYLKESGVSIVGRTLPIGILIGVGKYLHQKRRLFFEIVEKIKSEVYLGEEALTTLLQGRQWTEEVATRNRTLYFEIIQKIAAADRRANP